MDINGRANGLNGIFYAVNAKQVGISAFQEGKMAVCLMLWQKIFSFDIIDFDREKGRETDFSVGKNKKWGIMYERNEKKQGNFGR